MISLIELALVSFCVWFEEEKIWFGSQSCFGLISQTTFGHTSCEKEVFFCAIQLIIILSVIVVKLKNLFLELEPGWSCEENSCSRLAEAAEDLFAAVGAEVQVVAVAADQECDNLDR